MPRSVYPSGLCPSFGAVRESVGNLCVAMYSRMAMNGINLPLAFVGQEWIWVEVFKEYGLTWDDLASFFTGAQHWIEGTLSICSSHVITDIVVWLLAWLAQDLHFCRGTAWATFEGGLALGLIQVQSGSGRRSEVNSRKSYWQECVA